MILHSTRIPRELETHEQRLASFFHPEDVASHDHSRVVLSRRQSEILELVAKGLQDKEIAHQLAVSINTVKEHHKRMFRKMSVKSRSELLAKTMSFTIER